MKKNKLVHNTIMLYIMNIAKLIFPLLTLPYLTRVLSVEKYAVTTYVKAVMTYAQLVIDFGFILSATKDIVMANNDKTKIGYITGDVILGKGILAFASFAVVTMMTVKVPMLWENRLFVFLSFVAVALTVFFVDFLFRGLEKMQVMTIRYLITRSITTVLTFVVIKSDANVLLVPILDIIGNVVAAVWVWAEINRLGIKVRINSARCAMIKISESWSYFLSNMASTAFGALNTLFVGAFCTASDVAFWGLTMQLVNAVQALYSPIINAIYPHMVREKNFKVIKSALAIFMPMIAAGCLVIYFGADIILLLIGGQKYAVAAPLLKWFIPLLFVCFPAMLFGWPALGAIGKTKETTKTTIITAIAQVCGLVVLVWMNKITLENLALLRAATELLMCSLRMGYCYKYRVFFTN